MPISLLLTLLASLWLPPACGAGVCDCMTNGTVEEARAAAEAVFEGRVVSVRDTIIQFQESQQGMRAVTLRVGGAWKGVRSETVTLVTGWGGGDCGFLFETGEAYLVYAYRRRGVIGEPPLATSICSRTVELAAAAADVRALGEPVWIWATIAMGERTACSCRWPPTATDARDGAAAVFTGQVLSVRDTTLVEPGETYGTLTHVALLVVDRAWKGVEADTVEVMSREPCGFHFRAGGRYLVYAHRGSGSLGTSMCDRSAPLAEGGRVADDLRELGIPARTWPANPGGSR